MKTGVYVHFSENVNFLHLTCNYKGSLYATNLKITENIENMCGKTAVKYLENILKATVTEGRRSGKMGSKCFYHAVLDDLYRMTCIR